MPHYYNGELIGTSRRYDERLTLALLAIRRSRARPHRADYDPASAFEPDDIGALIERVERGPKKRLENADDEHDARYGEYEYDKAEDDGGSFPVSPLEEG